MYVCVSNPLTFFFSPLYSLPGNPVLCNPRSSPPLNSRKWVFRHRGGGCIGFVPKSSGSGACLVNYRRLSLLTWALRKADIVRLAWCCSHLRDHLARCTQPNPPRTMTSERELLPAWFGSLNNLEERALLNSEQNALASGITSPLVHEELNPSLGTRLVILASAYSYFTPKQYPFQFKICTIVNSSSYGLLEMELQSISGLINVFLS